MNNPIAEFHGNTFELINHNGQLWLTAQQAGEALGFALSNANDGITRLYRRHADEFDDRDTCTVKLTAQGQRREMRIFSASGCQLLGFFANTPRAKAFRAWAKQALSQCLPTQAHQKYRHKVRITRAIEKAVLTHYVQGERQSYIAQTLGIGAATVNLLIRGKYQFSPLAGTSECTPELLDAVAQRTLEDEQQKLVTYAERLAKRLRNTANNQQLATRIDSIGKHLQQPLDTAMLPLFTDEESAK